MAQAKITLIGLENYLNPDHSVFENINLPDGIDKDVLIGTILLRCQEFELLYTDPDFMIAAVNIWSRKNYWTFEKWVKLINKSYDPLYNKDYFEEITDDHEGDFTKSGTGSSQGQSNQSTNNNSVTDNTRTDNIHSTNDVTATHSEKAYNDSSFVGTTQDVTDQDQSQTGSVRNNGSVTDNGSANGSYTNGNTSNESGNDKYLNKHNYHGYGNIGITSAQELFIREAVDVATWNMYEHIADLFANEFCIMVY